MLLGFSAACTPSSFCGSAHGRPSWGVLSPLAELPSARSLPGQHRTGRPQPHSDVHSHKAAPHHCSAPAFQPLSGALLSLQGNQRRDWRPSLPHVLLVSGLRASLCRDTGSSPPSHSGPAGACRNHSVPVGEATMRSDGTFRQKHSHRRTRAFPRHPAASWRRHSEGDTAALGLPGACAGGALTQPA